MSCPRRIFWFFVWSFLSAFPAAVAAQSLELWSSSAELLRIPAEGCAWDSVLAAAQAADPAAATIANQDSENNVEILAAALVYARTGTSSYRDKVTQAVDNLVAGGAPADRTLAWAREVGAYALAADLVGYHPAAFESWLRNVAEVWVADDGRTLLHMFKVRPNNWGSHAFGSLAAIYGFLEDTARLDEVRSYWIQCVTGPIPAQVDFDSDLSWHADPAHPLLINPAGATKQGVVIDGLMPDDMQRNGEFADPPPQTTGYHWEGLQGQVMAARIFERLGLSIWDVADRALDRAFTVLQGTWEQEYGTLSVQWAADGDDEWMLPFIDEAYGTDWSAAYDPCSSQLYDHGKNAGWGWVTLGSTLFRDGFESGDTSSWSASGQK